MKGSLWHIRYPIEDAPGRRLPVATTRPETMLGDPPRWRCTRRMNATAIWSAGSRSCRWSGAACRSVAQRLLPIPEGHRRGEDHAAHDSRPSPWSSGTRLPMPSNLNCPARVALGRYRRCVATLAEPWPADPAFVRGLEVKVSRRTQVDRGGARTVGPARRGRPLTRLRCRTAIAAACRSSLADDAVVLPMPRCWRSPRSRRWRPARPCSCRSNGKHVLRLIRDIQPWCISPPDFVGIAFPAWYGSMAPIFAVYTVRRGEGPHGAREIPARRSAGSAERRAGYVVQFGAVAGVDWWPEKTKELARYYPGDVLVTGFDIIFFWVARMMMQGIHFMGEVPFLTGAHRWPGARRARPEDVEVEGQQHRPAGADRPLWRRCAALYYLRADRSRAGREVGGGARRELSAVRHQAVERGTLLRDE